MERDEQKILANLLFARMADPPDLIREDGKREFVVRCSPGQVQFRMGATAVRKMDEHPKDEEHPEEMPEDMDEEEYVVEGTASSTSEDWHGTEMSVRALEGMATQLNEGISFLPKHGNFLMPVEWSDEIGRTYSGTVKHAEVANANEGVEGFVLIMLAKLFSQCEMAKELIRRLDKIKQPIGLSIGGWFVEIRYILDDENEIDRIIIEEVRLDHIAAVRSASNPDACDLHVLRSAYADARAQLVEGRSAVPYQNLPLAPKDTAWSWNTKMQDECLGENEDWGRYKRAHLWFDPDKSETKAGYKLPIAMMMDGSLKAVWRGCSAAMAALNGARGGVDIPSEDRKKVYEHLKKYYKRFEEEIPELKSVEELSIGEVTDSTVLDAVSEMRQDKNDTGNQPAETTMENEKILELLGKLEQRLAAIEANKPTVPEIKPEQVAEVVIQRMKADQKPTDTTEADKLRTEIAELRAKVESRDQTLAMLATDPRVGRSGAMQAPLLSGDSSEFVREIEGLIQMTRSNGDRAPALCTVVTRNKDLLAVDMRNKGRGAKGEKFQEAINGAEDMLRNICRAAELDGIIGNLELGWRS